jgi:putative pyruvate formate lyase activating enzyme
MWEEPCISGCGRQEIEDSGMSGTGDSGLPGFDSSGEPENRDLGIQDFGNSDLSDSAGFGVSDPCAIKIPGSGAVFFTGCQLGCVFCQNHEIAGGGIGREISVDRLTQLFWELKEKGAANINLVTADHYIPSVCAAIRSARNEGFLLPFIYNCSGYETVETIQMLEGLVDVYLPDFKYWEPETAKKYSHAPDYPDAAKAAIGEMVRQCGEPVFDEQGMIKKGVIVRHLLLPGRVGEAKNIVRYLYETYGNRIYMSLMNQYTPVRELSDCPELMRRVTKREYERLLDYAIELGVTQAFIQEGETAKESFIPPFDLEGV